MEANGQQSPPITTGILAMSKQAETVGSRNKEVGSRNKEVGSRNKEVSPKEIRHDSKDDPAKGAQLA